MIQPALEALMKEVADEDGLHNLAKNYQWQKYVFPKRRSKGWRVNKWRGKSYTPSGAREKVIGPSRIATLRKSSGLTQKKVAQTIGINPATLSDIERKKLVATQEQRNRILSFYEVKERYYFDGKNGLAR